VLPATRHSPGWNSREPVLAVLEALETIEDEALGGRSPGSELSIQQQAVAPETLDLALHGRGVNAELPGDLPERGAPEHAKQQRRLEVRAHDPVGGGEGL